MALAHALYEKPPEIAEGFVAEDYASDPVDVLPDTEQAFGLFQYMRTQWRIGMGGPTGLDYSVLHQRMDRMSLEPEEYDDLECDIRVMEVAAIQAMYEKT